VDKKKLPLGQAFVAGVLLGVFVGLVFVGTMALLGFSPDSRRFVFTATMIVCIASMVLSEGDFRGDR
jgi:hypothetical protein